MADHNRWVKFYPRDWIADTYHLTTEENGAYFRLWMQSVIRDGALPIDVNELQALAGIRDAGKWKRIWGKIGHYFQLADNGTSLVQRRVLQELDLAKERLENARRGGKASGKVRASAGAAMNSSSTGVQLESNSTSTPDVVNHEPKANDQDQDQEQSKEQSTSPPARSTSDARLWNQHDWRDRFGRAWAVKHGTIAYGDAGDTKACVSLGYVLEALPAAERLAAQARAADMFAEFLEGSSPAAVSRRHPFVFFVQEFGGLRVPKPAVKSPHAPPRSQPLPKLVATPRPKFIPPADSPPAEAHAPISR